MELAAHRQTELRGYNPELRRYDDTTTWLAEVLDGHMRTPFEYHFDGRELYSRDGSALWPIFNEAIEDAEQFGPGLGFEKRRRKLELDEYGLMLAMAKGDIPNTMVVLSDFPPELMSASSDVGGYNVGRKQTMLRVIYRDETGKISMLSQSLDRSDRTALEAIYASFGQSPEPGELLGQRIHKDVDYAEQQFLIDRLMGIYDRSLQKEYGGSWYAGRRDNPPINTYDFVCRQEDLLQAFLDITGARKPTRTQLINLAAAMKRRFEGGYTAPNVRLLGVRTICQKEYALAEMHQAGQRAIVSGEIFTGCGLTVGGDNDSPGNEMRELGYGNKSEEDDFGPLKFRCPKGHWNKRPRAKSKEDFLTHCKTCNTSLKC